jgi:sortase (surface protein transpeptidase)
VLTIPSIGLVRSVVAGGQSTINLGAVTHYWSPDWRPRVGPGQAGTYWLAAHRFTHGAPFGRLPSLAIGAEVRVTSGGTTYVYTVTSREMVGISVSYGTVYGSNRSTPRILLQTCEGNETRLLVHGVLSRVITA